MNLPIVLQIRIFESCCNDNLQNYSKLIRISKKYKQIIENHINIYNLMYLRNMDNNTKLCRLIKKNREKLKSLCIDKLENIHKYGIFPNVNTLVVSKDINKNSFVYIHNFPSLKKVYINFGVHDKDKYTPIIKVPNTLTHLYICGNIARCVKRRLENELCDELNNNNLNVSIYKCGNNNYDFDFDNSNDLFNVLCENMDNKFNRLKDKKRSYENYEKSMNLFYNNKRICSYNYNFENSDNYEQQYDYNDIQLIY